MDQNDSSPTMDMRSKNQNDDEYYPRSSHNHKDYVQNKKNRKSHQESDSSESFEMRVMDGSRKVHNEDNSGNGRKIENVMGQRHERPEKTYDSQETINAIYKSS